MFNNLDNLIARLNEMIDSAEDKGLDVTEAEGVVADMTTKLDSTKASYDELKAYWINDVNSYKEANMAYESAREFFVNKLIPNAKDIYQDARTAYKNLKDQGHSFKTMKVDMAKAENAGVASNVKAQKRDKPGKDGDSPFATVNGNDLISNTDAAGAQNTVDESQA
jgi:hypothetical protein